MRRETIFTAAAVVTILLTEPSLKLWAGLAATPLSISACPYAPAQTRPLALATAIDKAGGCNGGAAMTFLAIASAASAALTPCA